MASIVAYMDVREGAITLPSRFVVAEARRVADAAGATVYALLPLGPVPQAQIEELAAAVSAAGADRVLCSSDELLAGPALDITHGALLAQVAERLHPRLILFPAGGVGVELGPPLAIRIGAAYVPRAAIDIREEERTPDPPSQRVLLQRWRAAGDVQRVVDVEDIEHAVVATLAAGAPRTTYGESFSEIEMLPCPEPKYGRPRELASVQDPNADVALCSFMILSALPASPALQAKLPPGTVVTVIGSSLDAAAEAACPHQLMTLSDGSRPGPSAVQSPWLAPGAERLRLDSAAPDPEGEMAGLAEALERLAASSKKVPA
jgi:hypothetical protein